MHEKNMILKLNVKMLSTNQIAGFLNFYYLKNYWKWKVDFLYAGTYLLKVQMDKVVLGGCGQACPGMLKKESRLKL